MAAIQTDTLPGAGSENAGVDANTTKWSGAEMSGMGRSY